MTISPPSDVHGADDAALHLRLAELEKLAGERLQMFQLILDTIPQSVFWKDQNLRYLGCNQAFARDAGRTVDEIIGATDNDMPWHDQAELYRADDRSVVETNAPRLNFEEPQSREGGEMAWLRTSKIPIHDSSGAVVGVLGMYEDITAQKRAEEERAQLQEELIRMQAAALDELSTPLIPISDDVVIMPLVGAVDSRRAQQVLDTLLTGVTASRARYAILDITGVSVVDTQVANGFIRAAQAAKLVGAHVILTGIRPEVAQTLVGLGADLSGIITHSTLQSGISFALARG